MAFQIVVKKLQSGKIVLGVESCDTVRSIKMKIQQSESLLPQQQRLVYSGKSLRDEDTLLDHQINDGSVLYLVTKLGWPRSIKTPSPSVKNITIKTLNGDKTISLSVSADDSVKKVKQKVEQINGIPINEQRLIFTGQRLMDRLKLSDYNVFDGCTLQIVIQKPLMRCQSVECIE